MICKSILLAALLCAVAASPAQAGPVVSFVLGIANALGATTGFGASFGAFAAGASFATSAIGATVLRLGAGFLLQAGATALVQARQSRSAPPPTPQEVMTDGAQPITLMRRVYGEVRLSGPFNIYAMKNDAAHYGIIVAAHSTVGPIRHFLDGVEVLIGADSYVSTAPFDQQAISLRAYTGQPGQVADATYQGTFPGLITSAFDYAGISYAALFARRLDGERASEVYSTGREPVYSPLWRGDDQVFDPRTNSRGYSNNAALVFAREAEFYGKVVNWAEVAVEADVCDQLVPNGDGGTQRRWTINRSYNDDQTWGAVMADMMQACDGFVYERADGTVGFKVGRWIEPTVVLTDRDLLSFPLSEREWGPDAPGQFVAEYVEPLRDYFQAPCGEFVADPAGQRQSFEAYAVNSHNQAVRLCKAQARIQRPRYKAQAVVGLIGFELIGQRFVRVQISEIDYDETFEIQSLVRNSDGGTWTVGLTSAQASDFEFDPETEEPPRPVYVQVQSDDDVPVPVGLTAAVVPGTGGVAQIALAWPAQAAHLTPVVRMRVADGDWQEIATPAGATSTVVAGLVDGQTYQFQLKNRTPVLRVSAWSPETPIAVVAIANTTPPAALAAFSVSVAGSDGVVTFTSPNDTAYSATRIWRGTTSVFADATAVQVEAGAPNLVDTWTDPALAAGTYYYWAAPLNGSGIAGPLSGPANITII